MQLLLEGAKLGRFSRVRYLKMLQPQTLPQDDMKTNDHSCTSEVVQQAWNARYQGRKHELLLRNICFMYRASAPDSELSECSYYNQVSVIQSSGSGKSRMVHEMSKLIFTIPVNLRCDSEISQNAYPHPDSNLRDFLAKHRSHASAERVYLMFLKYTFDSIRKVIQEQSFQQGTHTRKSIAKYWADLMSEDGMGGISKDRFNLYNNVISDTEKYENTPGIDSESIQTCIKSVNTAFQSLLEILCTYYPNNDDDANRPIEIFLYVDEAHLLHKNITPENKDGKTLYDIFCHSVDHLSHKPFFVVFLSTLSTIAQFAPTADLARSACIHDGHAKLQAPITETAFDCFFQRPGSASETDQYDPLVGRIKPGKLRHTDLSDVRFMARFGRPLFWTLFSPGDLEANENMMLEASVIDLAKKKLINAHVYSEKLPNEAHLAILDVVLSVGYEHRHQAVYDTLSTLVASHMCTAYSIPAHRRYSRSGYPSEPILAEAASQLLWTMRKKDMVLPTLKANFSNSILDRGELGELVGRELLTHAYQSAVKRNGNTTRFSEGCLVTDFIEELFAETHANTVLKSCPDNVLKSSDAYSPFETVFKGAKMRFTHFIKMGDSTGVTTDALWAAYIRCAAIICQNNQKVIDTILPVLFFDTVICKHVMTGILIQFKRRKTAGPPVQYDIDEDAVHFFGKEEICTHSTPSPAHVRPYIALVMELGVQAQGANKHNPDFTPSSLTITRFGDREQPSRDAKADSTNKTRSDHPRYQIFAYGCSSTIYKSIKANEKSEYAFLMKTSEFFPEHARQDPDSLSAVMQLKPLFEHGGDSYNWVEDFNLTGVKEEKNEETLGVSVPEDQLEDVIVESSH